MKYSNVINCILFALKFTYFTTDLGNDAFELPIEIWYEPNTLKIHQRDAHSRETKLIFIRDSVLNSRLPFDTKNPVGYLIVVLYQCIGAAYVTWLFASAFSIGIGACLLQLSLITDLKRSLHSVNKRAKIQGKQQQKTAKQLSHVIQLHSNSKQFVVFYSSVSKFVCSTIIFEDLHYKNKIHFFQIYWRICSNL